MHTRIPSEILPALFCYSGIIRYKFGCYENRHHPNHAEMLALLSEIDEFKGAWRALGTLAPERLNVLRRIANIESIGSSTRIEGSKLTDREVEYLRIARIES
jgi:hypothetical protein